ncbi:hypothetical protein J2T15_001045 [Paenibacillus harenae]|uniref:Z-ring formation inhibitor MciZ n=1 Tax=Paenibacillus harenae TaxID=306543 RepID=A0ABT9TX08_PAEHA|nr:hypothetical protein [Paenibacillus harenae]MDQ0111612.1 hypothetical protein [Paenibacillus harenae]
MKQYVASNQLRLVGKAWEIRHQLRKLSASGGSHNKLLSDFTSGTAKRRPLTGLRSVSE